MYCPDTLKRLNDKAVAEHMAKTHTCDYCDNEATEILEIFNPADALREPPVTGAYCTVNICGDCEANGYLHDNYFQCPDCGEWFIRNHSWDVLSVSMDDEEYCQKCAADRIEPVMLLDVIHNLERGATDNFIRINGIPGKEELWSGEFSQYDDFPGYTSLSEVARAIDAAAKKIDLELTTMVYPVIDHGYQFSVSLAVYK